MNREKITGKDYRIRKLLHDFEFTEEMSFEEKCKKTEDRLKELLTYGYGGIVTNVSFSNYLESEENWKIFEYIVNKTMDLGLILWIYDEKGYPSGKAGGKTLEGHPEYEALGLVMISDTVQGGQRVQIPVPYGHRGCVGALCWQGNQEEYCSDGAVDVSAYINVSGELDCVIPGSGTWSVAAFFVRTAFEGTHSHHNVDRTQRSINVLDSRAVRRFLELTYEPYTKAAGKWYGKGVEAFFTDEPSIMTPYLNWQEKCETVEDIPDEKIPLYAMLPWVDGMAEKYREETERELLYELPCLFGGKTGQRSRIRFYRFVNRLYEEAFFQQLSDFCQEKGIAFSGHLLLEEFLRFHGLFEGNLIRLLGRMQIPGMDMLSSSPEVLKNMVTTFKTAVSAAHLQGKKRIMCELSGYMEQELSLEMVRFALTFHMLQGVNIINSYYPDALFEPEEWRKLNDYCEMLGEVLAGEHVADVALYYPIETVWAYTTPSEKEVHPYDSPNLRNYEKELEQCEDCWNQVQQELIGMQMDYDILDSEHILSAEIREGCLIPTSGEKHKLLVLSSVAFMDMEVLEKCEEAAAGGVKLVIAGASCPRAVKQEEEAAFDILFENLCRHENVIVFQDMRKFSETVGKFIQSDVKTPYPDKELLFTHRKRKEGDCYLLLNGSKEKRQVTVQLMTGKEVYGTDPWSRHEICCIQEQQGEYRSIALELEGYSSVLLRTWTDTK